MERINPVILTDEDSGRTYTLDFTREVVRRAEGTDRFAIGDCEMFPTKLWDLFYYSFLAHHAGTVNRKVTDRLLDALGGIGPETEGLFVRLIELYGQAIKTLNDDEPKKHKVTFEMK